MYKTALIFGLILVGSAVALFFYGPPAVAPIIPAPEPTPDSLKDTGMKIDSDTNLATTTSSVATASNSKPVSRPAGAVKSISIENMAFEPTAVTINVGDIIVWTNKDAVVHTATGRGFDSGNLVQDESFAFRFEKAGSYNYSCTPHPNMKGTIIVK